MTGPVLDLDDLLEAPFRAAAPKGEATSAALTLPPHDPSHQQPLLSDLQSTPQPCQGPAAVDTAAHVLSEEERSPVKEEEYKLLYGPPPAPLASPKASAVQLFEPKRGRSRSPARSATSHARSRSRSRSPSRRSHDPTRSHRDRRFRSKSRSRSRLRSPPPHRRHRGSHSSSRSPRFSRQRSRSASRSRRHERSRSPRSSVRHSDSSSPSPRRRSPSPRRRSRSPPNAHSHRSSGHRSPSRHRSRGRGRRSMSPPPSDADRDRRTVFVNQLAIRATSSELRDLMSKAGRVRDVRIVKDRVTGRSKGFGYVEFHDEASLPAALGLSGTELLDVPIQVHLTEAEKNRRAEEAARAAQTTAPVPAESLDTMLRVSGLGPHMDDRQLKQLFEPFGYISRVSRDSQDGASTGVATVQFDRPEAAKRALAQMQGRRIANSVLRLDAASDPVAGVMDRDTSVLDDGPSLRGLNAAALRAKLMLKLARGDDLASQLTRHPTEALFSSAPSSVLLLSNVYDPREETDPTWPVEIGEDVRAECQKFGPVLKVDVMANQAGEICVKFADAASAQVALASLHGRWYGGRTISARFITIGLYMQLFPNGA